MNTKHELINNIQNNNPSLQEAIFSDGGLWGTDNCIKYRNELYQISGALKCNTNLVKLTLRFDLGFNDIPDFCILKDALVTNKTLKELVLSSKFQGFAIVMPFLEAFKTNTTITHLDISSNELKDNDAICNFIKNNKSIIQLNLFSNGGLQNILLDKALEENTSLKTLEIGACHLHNESIKALSQGLIKNHTLTNLNLSLNALNDAAAFYLGEALKKNNNLEVLNLSYNKFSKMAASLLSDALKSNTSLKQLVLYNDHEYVGFSEYFVEMFKSNYTLLHLEGVKNNEIDEFLKRNKSLAEILKPLQTALDNHTLLKDKEVTRDILNALEKLLPNLQSLPEDSYPVKAYGLLTALLNEHDERVIDVARQRFLNPLPIVPEKTQPKTIFFCEKQSKKTGDFKNSNIRLFRDNEDQGISFFMENKLDKKTYPKGGCGKVKQGSLTNNNGSPQYAVKIYDQKVYSQNKIHALRLAMRAAYCYEQLGQSGYVFSRNGKQYLVSDWVTGPTLKEANQNKVQAISIPQRIVMAISLLKQLNVLHKLGLIQYDIKPENVMINFDDEKLYLVDMDSVRPKNEKPLENEKLLYTPSYVPDMEIIFAVAANNPNVYMEFNEKTDLHAMALTLTYLFQDIFITTQKPCSAYHKQYRATLNYMRYDGADYGPSFNQHPKLGNVLLQMMMAYSNGTVKSCEDYIKEFQNVLKTYPDHEQYLAKDIGMDREIPVDGGKKAFNEIERELLGYDESTNSVRPLGL